MKPKTRKAIDFLSPLHLIAFVMLVPSATYADDYTWDGGGGDASWLTGTNWVGDPGSVIMGIDSTQTFITPGALNLDSYLEANRVLGHLNFNSAAVNNISVRFYSNGIGTGGGNRDLNFDVSSGNASITVVPNAAANITLGVAGGNMVLSDNLDIIHNGSGNLTINQFITGLGYGLTKSGGGTLTLSAINSFDGGLALSGGTLNINHQAALGFAAGTFLVGGGTTIDNTSGGAVTKFNHPMTIDGDFTFTGTQNLNLGTGAVTLGTTAGTERTITVNGGELAIGGNIADGTTATGLVKAGGGALVLAGANSHVGGTTLHGGTLTLDYSVSDTSKLSDTGVLDLKGGTINLSGGTHAEAVGSTTITAGGTQLSRPGGTGTLALGAITRSPYATLNINSDFASTTTTAVNGILGGGITRFGRFAKLSGTNIVINTGETNLPPGATSATVNYTTAGNIIRTADSTLYSLRYQAGAAPLKAVDLGGFALTIDSGGLILVNNNANQILNGTLKGSASGELIVHCVGTIDQVLDAKVSNNGGATAFVKAGPAALKLGSAANDYTGPTFVNEGSLKTTVSEVIPDTSTVTIFTGATLDVAANTETVSTVLLDGGTISSSGAGTLNNTGSAYDMRSGTVAGKLGGPVGLVKSTKGTLTLSAVNTFTGGTTIDEGIIKAGSGSAFGTGNGTPVVINSAGTLDINGKGLFISTFSGSGILDNTSSSANTVQIGKNGAGGTFSGVIRNSGGGNISLWKWGGGTTILSGANTYTGLTWLVGGIMSVDSIGSIASPAPSSLGSPIDLANGAIRFSSGAASVGTLKYTGATTSTDRPVDLRGSTAGGNIDASGAGPITFTGDVIATGVGSKTLTLQGTNTDANTFAGLIVDNDLGVNTTSVSKSDAGTWVLTGNNPYTGTTTVDGGKLIVNGIQTGAGACSVSAAATLGGTGTLPGTVTVFGTLAPGASIGTFSTGPLVLETGAILAVEINTSTVTADKIIVTGDVTRPGTTADLVLTDLGSDVALPNGTKFTLVDYSGTWNPADVVRFGGVEVPNNSTITLGANTFALKYDDGTDMTLTVQGGAASPFQTWIDTYSVQIPNAADRLPDADPDFDGVSNLAEFALKGDPANASNNGLTAVLIQDTDFPTDTNELTLVAAVRRGATFTANGDNAQAATVDQVQYTVQGSLALDLWNSAVSAIAPGADTAPVGSGLTEDLTGTGWEYRTFSLDASEGLATKGFLRVKISN